MLKRGNLGIGMKMEWKVSVFPEKNGNGEKPTFRFVGSRHRAKPTFKSRRSCSCLTLLHGSTPHGRSACHSPQTEYTITFPPTCRWIAPWSTSTTGRDLRVGGGQLAVAWTPKNFLHSCCSRLLRPLNAEQPRAPGSGAGDALSAGAPLQCRCH